MNRIPYKRTGRYIRQQYPVGTRITLHSMDDPQSPPPGTKGTVSYVDDIGQIGVKWDTGSSLSLIPGVDSFLRNLRRKKQNKRSVIWSDESVVI